MSQFHVHSLHYYPVKALGGHSVSTHTLEKRGFKDDRRWMFVDANGRFMSQRKYRSLVQWRATVEQDTLVFSKLDGSLDFKVAKARTGAKQLMVTVWDDTFLADWIDFPHCDELTHALGISGARLVYMSTESHRQVDQRFASPEDEVSFADGFPYLITNTASLRDFSERVGEELAMSRFRPNIVIDTPEPWTEDHWKALSIGGQPFATPKPCARCQVITINQETGEQRMELLVELARFRKVGSKVMFGVNALFTGKAGGSIRVGDVVEVIG